MIVYGDEDDDRPGYDPDPCPDCGREFACVCGDPHYCRECETYGGWQCRAHGDAYIEMQRAELEQAVVREALETLKSNPEAWSSNAYQRLWSAACEVLREMDAAEGRWPQQPTESDHERDMAELHRMDG